MKNLSDHEIIEANLIVVLDEMERQNEIEKTYLPGELSYGDEMAQIREFIEIAGSMGLRMSI